MIDFQNIGKDGIIIQYEDIISLMGYNVLHTLKEKFNTLRGMSDEDILLAYMNREIENPSDYIKQAYGIDFPIEKMYQSEKVLRPNLIYVYKFFDSAYKNGVTKLSIYSNQYSPVIEKMVKVMFQSISVQYLHTNIEQILKSSPNYTFITTNTKVIRECGSYGVPFVLTIVDDFMYMAPIIMDGVADQLRRQNVYVGFTGVLSAGLIQ